MNKEEQIEEMAKTLTEIAKQPVMIDGLENWSDAIAEHLYNAGYRKASEVAREIIETLESGMEEPITEWHKGYFAAMSDVVSMLKKKYPEGEG